ncbi:MAG TPA: HAMP domain-containing sensor histidine kinase [Thermoanaerobaculia bacterium]|nr:HAMP domain-containing sensor histidine kinase [Thermoanaerobaculia bacterium]
MSHPDSQCQSVPATNRRRDARSFSPRRVAFATAIGYVILATLWIVFSDYLLELLVDVDELTFLQSLKGLLFVTVTGALLYFLMLRLLDRARSLEGEIQDFERVESIGRLATTITHEFNNVLQTISTFAELLRRASHDPGTQKALSRIDAAVDRGRRLSQEILRFAHPAEPVRETLDAAAYMERLASDLRPLLPERIALRIECNGAGSFPADPDQLHQLFTNLVLNARDATHGEGTITLRCSRPPGSSRFAFEVADQGEGIPPDLIGSVFEPFLTTKRNGTGLGLAVVRQIVANHRGQVSVSSAPGKGTTMTVELPR